MSFDEDLEAETPPPATDKATLAKVAAAIKDAGVDPTELGKVERVRYYEGFHKDDDGDTHVVPMLSLAINPTWADGPDWPVVAPAPRPPVRATTAKRTVVKGWHKAVVLPDCQIGARRYVDGDEATYDPFHDEAAIAVALSIVRAVRPDQVILLGDNLDFPEWGRYEQEPEFQETTQYAIDRAGLLLDQVEAAAPEADCHWLEGNHERRLPKAIAKNAMAALRLRRANAPASWPVLSVPALLDLDDRSAWTYHDGYPAASVRINDHLVAEHGSTVYSAGSTAAKVARSSPTSRIFGHIHREEFHAHTWYDPAARARHQSFAASPGCLCRVDGTVPGSSTATNGRGKAVNAWQGWQQGIAVVTFQEGDGRVVYERVGIEGGAAIYRDKEHRAR